MTAPTNGTYVAGPFDSNHLYVQWGGKLPGNEQWSCGVRMYGVTSSGDPGNPGEMNAQANAMLDAVGNSIQAYHTSTSAYISNAAKLSFVKINAIGQNGRYMVPTTNERLFADVPGAGPGNPPHPNQVALAISLVTGFSRGPAHRGRFYMPMPMFAVGNDGLISDTDRDFAAVAATELVLNMNFAGNLPNVPVTWKVGVFSRKLGVAGHREVTGCEVGRVLDTQRRRRRSLLEDY